MRKLQDLNVYLALREQGCTILVDMYAFNV